MFRSIITKYLLLFFVLNGAVRTQAQHYIFIETENQQKFHIKLDGKTLASSELGFLILSRLSKDTLDFSAMFTNDTIEQHSFSLVMAHADNGYLLKKSAEGYWFLSDRLTMSTILEKQAVIKGGIKVNVDSSKNKFGVMLAQVTNDPGLLANERSKQDGSSVKKSVNDRRLPMQKISEKNKEVHATDPIVLPLSNEVQKTTDGASASLKFNDTVQTKAKLTVTAVPTSVGCSYGLADGKDILTIKKKLLGLDNIEEQIGLVQKLLKSKCITTAQAKDIGVYFIGEASKLKLYTRLHPYVADPASFPELESQFREESNIRMLRKFYTGN